MNSDEAFADLLRRVRTGDEQAATQLVRQYEPEIRRVVRIRLANPRLQQVLDSMDICQSVLANFFTRAAAGQFDLETPDQLIRLLISMARNKVTDAARRQNADRRDVRRQTGEGALAGVADPGGTPSEVVATAELVRESRRRMTPEERYLAEQRAAGKGWAELAQELGDGPEALRKKLSRAMDRIAQELGLGEAGDE
jgi:RNA polymerase sigma-70 factor (ECF subfamily)